MSDLLTAAEKVMLVPVRNDPNRIPKITDPMGKYWTQPDTAEIVIDDEYALMSESAFEKLAEYSYSQPSRVYPGKMWKRNNGVFDLRWQQAGGLPYWQLCWYGYATDGDSKFCSNNTRRILVASLL